MEKNRVDSMAQEQSELSAPREKRSLFATVSRRLFLSSGLAAAGSLFIGNLSAIGKAPISEANKMIDYKALQESIKGQVATPGNANFSKFAYGELFNKLQPNRAPQVIVRVANEQDVCAAIKFAKANKLKVVVRGGGHNWCSPSLRNGGMMIDLTDLNQVISIDKESKIAVSQPIVSNRDMQKHLNAEGLAFPTGHCPPVKISGYLLGGGMAWNQGVWGPGVGSVEAIELVTADGELITASKDKNIDYFWAARGAGCGFFGVATKYHLKLYPLPQYITASSYTYSMDDLGTVSAWLARTAPSLPSKVELSIFLVSAPPELADKCKAQAGKVCLLTASVFADTEAEAIAATKFLDSCPVIDKCLAKSVNEHSNFEKLFDMSGALWPTERRNQVEAMFSNSNAEDLFNAIGKHFQKAPSPEALIMFAFFTGPNVPAPLIKDAAFSMSAKLYGGPWTMWKDAKDDESNLKWHAECVQLLKPFVHGHYIGETDTVTYPDHTKASYIESNFNRIEELRKKYDPAGVFFNYSEALS